MRLAVRLHHRQQRATIISSFFRTPLRNDARNVELVGPILRPEILHALPKAGDYILSYLRPHTPAVTLELLHPIGTWQRNVARFFRGQIDGTPHALATIDQFLPQAAP